MKSILLKLFSGAIVFTLLFTFQVCAYPDTQQSIGDKTIINLPEPNIDGDLSVEKAMQQRRSIRSYKDEPITTQDISQLLWAAQGITDSRGFRTAPSAGATYPLDVYLVINQPTDEITSGIYYFNNSDHSLELVKSGNHGDALSIAALNQSSVKSAPVNIVITACLERTAKKYKDRAPKYVHIEVGAVCQNIHLQCVSLGLGTVVVGAFTDDKVSSVIDLHTDCAPMLIMPIGKVQ